MWVNGNWRITFRFVGTDVELVNYQDYHGRGPYHDEEPSSPGELLREDVLRPLGIEVIDAAQRLGMSRTM